jgi:peptidoglycan/LPS O-acetylase OafA/YrhL
MPELDSIRFLSIVLVVLHHQFFDANPFLAWMKAHGWIGVDIFFVMSGFLITTLLLHEQARTGRIALGRFWQRRMLRLWPSWGVTLVLSVAMVWGLSRDNPEVRGKLSALWWHYPLHVGNYSYVLFGKIHTLFSHFWSLAVEEHFYVLWPLVLVVFRRRGAVVAAALALVVASTAARYLHWQAGASWELVSFSTHTRLDQLLFGCLLAYAHPHIPKLGSWTEALLTGAMLALFYVGLYHCDPASAGVLMRTLRYTFIGAGALLLLIIATRGGRRGLRAPLAFPLAARLGVLSYGVYLVHLHVNYVVFPLARRFPWLDHQGLLAALNLILPFVPAYLLFRYVDAPFARLKTRGTH